MNRVLNGNMMGGDNSHGPVVMRNHSHGPWSMHGNHSHGEMGKYNHSRMYNGLHGPWRMHGNHSHDGWPANKSIHGEWSLDNGIMTWNMSEHP
jgi:hypothetical protein